MKLLGERCPKILSVQQSQDFKRFQGNIIMQLSNSDIQKLYLSFEEICYNPIKSSTTAAYWSLYLFETADYKYLVQFIQEFLKYPLPKKFKYQLKQNKTKRFQMVSKDIWTLSKWGRDNPPVAYVSYPKSPHFQLISKMAAVFKKNFVSSDDSYQYLISLHKNAVAAEQEEYKRGILHSWDLFKIFEDQQELDLVNSFEKFCTIFHRDVLGAVAQEHIDELCRLFLGKEAKKDIFENMLEIRLHLRIVLCEEIDLEESLKVLIFIDWIAGQFDQISNLLERADSQDNDIDICREVLFKLRKIPDFRIRSFAKVVTKVSPSNLLMSERYNGRYFEFLKRKLKKATKQFNFYIRVNSLDDSFTHNMRVQLFEKFRSILMGYYFKIEGIYNENWTSSDEVRIGFKENYLPDIENNPEENEYHMFLIISGRRGGQELTNDIKFIVEESVSPYKAPKILPKPSKETIQRIERLKHFKNLVLEGVPGTGKTFALNVIKLHWFTQTKRHLFTENNEPSPFAITFHPSTSYEDFVEGLRPLTATNKNQSPDENHPEAIWFHNKLATSKGNWGVKDGFFLKICQKAIRNPHHDFIILIDELNRANIPKVFGDLITTIERSKRATYGSQEKTAPINLSDWNTSKCQIVELPYSGRKFFVPENIYIVATQNTTDRSVAPLDAALRRRFAFLRMNPHTHFQMQKSISQKSFEASITVWTEINQKLQSEIGPDAVLGHSYFYVVYEEVKEKPEHEQYSALRFVWEQELLPQLVDTLQSADRIDILEDFQELFNKIDPDYRFEISISGEALYRLPIISIVEKEVSTELSAVLRKFDYLEFELRDYLDREKTKAKSENQARFRLKEDLGLYKGKRLFHIKPKGELFLLRDENQWPKMFAYIDEQLDKSALFNLDKCSPSNEGREDILVIPYKVWASNIQEFVEYIKAMINAELNNIEQ